MDSNPNIVALVLGKYKIGDVVKSLKTVSPYRNDGDLFEVNAKSTEYSLYYKLNVNSGDPYSWDRATPVEIEAYHRGVKNVKDIKDIESTETKIINDYSIF